jgi:hypothetical protein
VHPVVAHLEIADARVFAFPGFDLQEKLGGVFTDAAQLVELTVEAGGDDAAVADDLRRVVDQRALQEVQVLGKFTEIFPQRCQGRGGQPLDGAAQRGQALQRLQQSAKIPRPRRSQRHPGHDALHVADGAEGLPKALEAVLIQQCLDGVQARIQHPRIAQGAVQPAPQLAGSHGRAAAIQDTEQGVRITAGEVAIDFQVASRRRIQHDAVLTAFHAQGRDVGQGAALCVAHVVDQAACRADRQRQVLAAEPPQVVNLELLRQCPLRGFGIELPARLCPGTGCAPVTAGCPTSS